MKLPFRPEDGALVSIARQIGAMKPIRSIPWRIAAEAALGFTTRRVPAWSEFRAIWRDRGCAV